MTVLERFRRGEIRGLSRIVSFVENREAGFQELLGHLYTKAGHSLRIGVTGPPGAGKSTLVDGLAAHFLKDGKRVGIVAVDPTSPFTGGALLGDRVRMNQMPADGSVYFRSMATRGATGGLAGATDNVAVVYDAFGFDVTLIETVGVGQVELDIVDSCDSVVVVLVPESGDAVQTMKAGLMEIADIFCINKSDRPGAERIAADLKQMLDTRKAKDDDWRIPIVSTEAITSKNVDRLYGAVLDYADHCQRTGLFETRRQERLKKKILSIVRSSFQREFMEHLENWEEFDQFIERIRTGETNPFEAADNLFAAYSGR